MDSVKVKVTQEHISKGTPNNGSCCPIALALKDMGYQDVEVNIDDITFMDGPVYWSCGFTPSSVDGFITTFDAEGPTGVNPFEFWLERTTPDLDEDMDEYDDF